MKATKSGKGKSGTSFLVDGNSTDTNATALAGVIISKSSKGRDRREFLRARNRDDRTAPRNKEELVEETGNRLLRMLVQDNSTEPLETEGRMRMSRRRDRPARSRSMMGDRMRRSMMASGMMGKSGKNAGKSQGKSMGKSMGKSAAQVCFFT